VSTREITLPSDVFEKLCEIMKKRGFPEKPVSESDVIAEAIELLHKKKDKAVKDFAVDGKIGVKEE